MIKITKLEIEKFRHFQQGTEIQLGNNVTLIAGCNGTGKSSILGMIGQPIGFPDRIRDKSLYTQVYNEFELLDTLTPYGKKYRTAYSEVFRLSNDFDKPENIEYRIFLDGDAIDPKYPFSTEGLVVKGQKREKQKPRMVAHETHEKGEGNFPHPVLFLGLNRLRPLAQVSKLQLSKKTELDAELQKYWIDSYCFIMGKRRTKIISEKVDTESYKGIYESIKTETYDSGGASSGEDNIGQIISAVISFFHLKRKFKDKYQGGVLLIDELDATLHPIAQLNLLAYLVKKSEELNIQIIATTHSLSLLEDIRKFGKKVKLVFLLEEDGQITVENEYDYNMMMDVLVSKYPEELPQKHTKTTVLFEDNVAVAFFRQVTCGIFSKYINIPIRNSNHFHMPESILRHFATYITARKVPEFMKIICILDPDCEDQIPKKHKSLLCLPGSIPIECLIFNFIHDYPDNVFRKKYKRERKNFFYCENALLEPYKKGENSDNYKKWFQNTLKELQMRENSPALYSDWSEQHKSDCKKFCQKFLRALIAIENTECTNSQKEIEKEIEKKFSIRVN